jgi:hypothetical protein
MEITDNQFGTLLLIDDEVPDRSAWLTSVSLPYFEGSGGSLNIGRPERKASRFNSEILFRKAKFRLIISCGSPPMPPTDAHRVAWRKVLDRGDALWNAVMRQAVVEYKRQRPARLDAWKRMYGRTGITRSLPQVATMSQMRKLIRPYELTILDANNEGAAEVRVKFFCTWFNGLTVRIRDGRMTGFLRNPFCSDPIDLPPVLHHPVLGPLGWQDGAWHGHVRCDPFRHFVNIARWCTPDSNAAPDSTLGWDLARGEFPLKIFSPADRSPSREHVRMLQQFQSRESNYAADIAQAIFDDYVENYAARADEWLGPNMEYLLPELNSTADLLDLIELDSINLSPSGKAADLTIAFEFSCTWSMGIGVHWKNGKVTKIGPRQITRPLRLRKRKK